MDDGCVVTPGSNADKAIQRAWDEDRILPVNAAARENYKRVKGKEYSGPTLEEALQRLVQIGKSGGT